MYDEQGYSKEFFETRGDELVAKVTRTENGYHLTIDDQGELIHESDFPGGIDGMLEARNQANKIADSMGLPVFVETL